MDRRTFLQSTGAPLGAAALGSVVPSLVQVGAISSRPVRT
ncbi:MAG: hypothetical protein RLZZ467_1306, partial [Gemmatimonadota bacterium]